MKKHILLVIILLVSMTTNAQKRMSKNKKALVNSIEKHKKNLIEISDNIWEAAEPALLEFKSSNYLSDYAEENGFTVKKGVAGIQTAFVAEYGSGKPIIGIMGEFDANLGISQKNSLSKILFKKGHLAMVADIIFLVLQA
jgi:aminobenzoyl-glutamate utilization protein B